MKSCLEKKRRDRRLYSKRLSSHLKKQGRIEEAEIKWRQSLNITAEMAYPLIKMLKKMNIEFYVSPYEADA
jgi:hypothetical protein